jgi:hypothetical protein
VGRLNQNKQKFDVKTFIEDVILRREEVKE